MKSVETTSGIRDTTAQNGDTNDNSKTLRCSLCLEVFPNMLEFNEHKTVIKNSVCHICQAHLSGKTHMANNCATLMDHLEKHHKIVQHNWIHNS